MKYLHARPYPALLSDRFVLTAGAAGTAEPTRRRQTLAVHPMLGYVLDLANGMSCVSWGLSIGLIALLMLAALVAFRLMRPLELSGDRANK